MGYGRYVVVRFLNALLVLFIAILISVSIFSVLERVQYEAQARNELMMTLRGMKITPEYRTYTLNKTLETPLNDTVKNALGIKGGKIKSITVNITNDCSDTITITLRKVTGQVYKKISVDPGKSITLNIGSPTDRIEITGATGCTIGANVKYVEDVTQQKLNRIMDQKWQQLVKKYGLDQPLYVRIANWTIRTLTLDFGEARQAYPAYGKTKNVRSMILLAIGRTALLFTTAEIIAVAIGLILGLYAAYRRGGIFDRSLSVFALTTNSIPMYWLGMILILLFAYTLGWFPPRSWEAIPEDVKASPLSLFIWYLHHMALPLFTIVFVAFGSLAWYTRNIALSTFQEDFIMVAWAKGLPSKRVLMKHVLRAISPPIVTMSTFAIVFSFFGAIISEVVFQWPGMGRLYYSALSNTDTPVVMAVTYLSIMVAVFTKFVLDLIYGFLDPRVKTA